MLEVVAGKILDQAGWTEGILEPLTCGVVIGKRPAGQLVGVNEVSFGRQEPIQQIPDGQAVSADAGRAAGV